MAVPCSRLFFGGGCEIACTPCLKIKNKNEMAHSHTETKPSGPRIRLGWPQGPGSLLCSSAGKRGRVVVLPSCSTHSLRLLGWWWGQQWHFAGEATSLWWKFTPQSWYPAAFGETAAGFHLPRPRPRLCSFSHFALQCGSDSPRPKMSGSGSFRLHFKKLFIYVFIYFWASTSSPGPQSTLCWNRVFVLLWLEDGTKANEQDALPGRAVSRLGAPDAGGSPTASLPTCGVSERIQVNSFCFLFSTT